MKGRRVETYGKIVLLIILFSGIMSSVVYAQQASETEDKLQQLKFTGNWTAGASFHTGSLLNHHNDMSILNEKKPWLVELYMAKKTYGERAWHSFFGYPDIGLKFSIIEIGSPTYIGKSYTIHPFIKFYLSKGRFRPSITAAAGPAYVEKTFDRKTNYKNTAIGSHINAFLQLQADLNVRITYSSYVFGGLSLSHMSNGSYKKPNAGVNIVTSRIGAGYNFGEIKMRKPADYTEPGKFDSTFPKSINGQTWSYRAILAGGLKERTPIGGSRYGVGSLSFEVSRKHLAYTRFSGSFDMFYDASDYHGLVYDIGYDSEGLSKLQTMKVGLAAGYELLFGHVAVNLQLGAYLYAKETSEGRIYQRYTLRYMPTNHFGIQFGLKSHMGVADYIELGCIYKIK